MSQQHGCKMDTPQNVSIVFIDTHHRMDADECERTEKETEINEELLIKTG